MEDIQSGKAMLGKDQFPKSMAGEDTFYTLDDRLKISFGFV
jgi:hypothetical protein